MPLKYESHAARKPGWSLVIWWVLAHSAAYLAVVATSRIVQGPELLGLSLCIASGIGILAVLQGLILRYYAPFLDWLKWIGATILGYILAFSLIALCVIARIAQVEAGPLTDYMPRSTMMVLLLVAVVLIGTMGAIVAFTQGTVLRPHIRHLEWWVAANAASMFVTAFVALLVPAPAAVLQVDVILRMLVIGVTGAAIVGVITGVTLVSLLRKTSLESSSVMTS
jgi:hypothetical protein